MFQTALNPLQSLLTQFTQTIHSGGSYTPPGNRLLLAALAVSLGAKDILETGYDAGVTTLALAMTGARVVAIDNGYEYASVKTHAREILQPYPNVELVTEDALVYLVGCLDASFDLIFIDDCHWPEYTRCEILTIQRVLRPGGFAVFHDTLSAGLWTVLETHFPATWPRLNLPSLQDWPGYAGNPGAVGADFGLGLVRKPVHT